LAVVVGSIVVAMFLPLIVMIGNFDASPNQNPQEPGGH
jgi:hypothetical protein